MHACGDGGDRGLLETGLAHFERRRFYPGVGQCRARQERPGAQDRCQRRHLAGRSDGPRTDPRQLCAGYPNTGTARPAAHSQAVRSRTQQPCPASSEDTGGRQHQTRWGDQRYRRVERSANDRGSDRRRKRSRGSAALAHRQIKASPAALREGVTNHHRFLLQLHVQHIDALDAALNAIDREVDIHVESFREAVLLLTTIPGVSDLSAQVIRAEIGGDMSRFPTVGHLISWAGLSPKNDESAGKRRSNRMRKCAPWLKTTLIQCAWAAARKNGSYLQAQFHRLRARRGAKKAIGALAASILTAAYHMLKDGTLYHDLGPDHFDCRARPVQTRRLITRLQKLGYAVQITALAG